MLARKFRLPAKEFPRNAVCVVSSYILLKFSLQSRSHNRFAIVISVKTEKSSVRRHALKRALSEILPKWPPLGIDAVLILKRSPTLDERAFFAQDTKELGEKISREHCPRMA